MVFSIQSSAQYKFNIEEIDIEDETFTVLHPKSKDVYDIIEEAARLFYYGKSGWTHIWPLMFILKTPDDKSVARADVYICSSKPHFDVILKEL